MRKVFGTLGACLAVLFLTGMLAAPANADPTPLPQDECRTVTSKLTERPDNGSAGVWAIDTLTRVAKVCVVVDPPEALAKSVPVDSQMYTAKVTDTGTFVTLGGANLSPAAKGNLVAGVKGTVKGSFEFAFVAPAKWGGFDASQMLEVKGAEPTTGNWIKAMWTIGGYEGKLLDTWKWTYQSCNETWVEAATGMSGDITGAVPCSSASPSPSPSVSATPLPSTTPVGNGSNTGGLPVTGAKTKVFGALGAGLILVGGAIAIGLRRRRVRFQA